MKAVRLIVDGSALGNPGCGGWACILQYQASERVLTGSEPESTNNKMEMVAALRELQAPQRAMCSRGHQGLRVFMIREPDKPSVSATKSVLRTARRR